MAISHDPGQPVEEPELVQVIPGGERHVAPPEADGPAGGPAPRRRLRAFIRNRPGMVGSAFLLLVLLVVLFGPWLAPHSPSKNDLSHVFAKPSANHLLGTDDLGRDVLSRLLYATRISMFAGVASVVGSLLIAVPIGMIAGYFEGFVDRIVVILVDVILSVPPLILVFAIAGVLGPNLNNAIIALAVYFTPMFIRLVRTEALRVRHSQLVEAERAVGVSDRRIVVTHVLPNIAPALVVQVALTIGTALLAEASLSFLGLGVRPPLASWGVMLRSAFDTMVTRPWLVFIPAAAIALTVLAFNVVADALRDALGRVEG
jgi:ABC-type dipeptide/oligopeptide/nickel transport system permease subunit